MCTIRNYSMDDRGSNNSVSICSYLIRTRAKWEKMCCYIKVSHEFRGIYYLTLEMHTYRCLHNVLLMEEILVTSCLISMILSSSYRWNGSSRRLHSFSTKFSSWSWWSSNKVCFVSKTTFVIPSFNNIYWYFHRFHTSRIINNQTSIMYASSSRII